jgi:hypothetical protein
MSNNKLAVTAGLIHILFQGSAHAEHAGDSKSFNPGKFFCSAGMSSQIVHTSLTEGSNAAVRKMCITDCQSSGRHAAID